MDAFFASVEQRDRPHLRGRAVAVGGDAEGRGVIAAASYEARRFGVRSAMPTRRALRLCPELVVLPPDFARYRRASLDFMAILADYSDVLEPLALDEASMDVTSDRQGIGSAMRTAEIVRQRVRAELHLTCSAGVAPLKFLAKIASGWKKPDGLTVVRPDAVDAFLRPLPIDALWGVGPSTKVKLQAMGLNHVGDLADWSEEQARRSLGRSIGLWRMARGEDDRPVGLSGPRRSRGAEQTFPEDLSDRERCEEALSSLITRLVAAMVRDASQPKTLTVKVRYRGFETVTRSRTEPMPHLDETRWRALGHELLSASDVGRRPVRLLGASFSGFEIDDDAGQLKLPLSPAEAVPSE